MTKLSSKKDKETMGADHSGRSFSGKRSLKWDMILLLSLCWILPIALIAGTMLYFVSNKVNTLVERTILSSNDRAVEMCEAQLSEVTGASRNASYQPQIKNAYNQFRKDGSRGRLARLTHDFLSQQYMFNDKLLSAMIIYWAEPDTVIASYNTGRGITYNNILQFKNRARAVVLDKSKHLDTRLDLTEVDGHLYLIRNMVLSMEGYRPYAIIIMELDKAIMYSSLGSVWGYEGGAVYENGEPLARLDSYIDIDGERLLKETGGSVLVRDEQGYYVYQVVRTEGNLYGYVVKLNSQAILDELDAIRYAVIVLVLFMIPLIVIVLNFFHRKVTKPVNELVRGSHRIEEGEYGHLVEDIGNSREFAYLGEAFNSMSTRLQIQFEQIYMEELALKDAEIKALQSQINPHFLNNTLEIISWESRLAGNEKASHMIEALSTMLGATLNRKQQQFILLSEELSYVDAYLYIIKERLGDRLTIEKNVEDAMLNVEVPRLIIQPIIENAVEHGVGEQNSGFIRMNIFGREDKLVIEIVNSGAMTEADKEKVGLLLSPDYDAKTERALSVGIRNVNRRLRIIYGNSCGLSIKSDEKNQTVSTLIVKIDYENNKRQ